MTAPDDVRACPFCGHAGPFDQMPYAWLDGSGANVIRCPMCHGAAPAKTWNRRAAHADLAGEVRELVEADREYDAAEAGLSRNGDGPLSKRLARFNAAGKRRSAALAKFHPTHQEKHDVLP